MKDLATRLNPSTKSEEAIKLEAILKSQIFGQDSAIDEIVKIIQSHSIGLQPSGSTISNVLFTGSSGVGKTKLVNCLAKELFGNEKAFWKVSCGEFQLQQDLAKITGAPPGYTGHKDTSPLISQEILDQYQNDKYKINLVLFDEIEKATEGFSRLLLGILGEAQLKTNQNTIIDFSKSIIFMTSNLGASEMKDLRSKNIGFTESKHEQNLDNRSKLIVKKAVEKHFAPEFIGRIDHIVNFNSLTHEDARNIITKELVNVKKQIFTSPQHCKFTLIWSQDVIEFILDQGYSKIYGARDVLKAIQRNVISPLSSLIAAKQIELGDTIRLATKDSKIEFIRIPGDNIATIEESSWIDYKSELELAWKADQIGMQD